MSNNSENLGFNLKLSKEQRNIDRSKNSRNPRRGSSRGTRRKAPPASTFQAQDHPKIRAFDDNAPCRRNKQNDFQKILRKVRTSPEVLVMGESHANRLERTFKGHKILARLLKIQDNRILNIGVGGLLLHEQLYLLKEHQAFFEQHQEVKHILILIGANNGFRVQNDQDIDDISFAMMKIQKRMRGFYPRAKIYLFHSIPPHARQHDVFQQINSKIKPIDANVFIVPCPFLFQKPTKMYYTDDVHLNQRGYQKLVEQFKKVYLSSIENSTPTLSRDDKAQHTEMLLWEERMIETLLAKKRVPSNEYMFCRLNGEGFTELAKPLVKPNVPFDERITKSMVSTARDLMNKFNPIFAFTASDDIILVWDLPQSSYFHDGKVWKIISALASYASVQFSTNLLTHRFESQETWDWVKRGGCFDCRLLSSANKNEIVEYILWKVCAFRKHSVQTIALSQFGVNFCKGKSLDQLLESMNTEGAHWESYPAELKNGVVIKKREVDRKMRNMGTPLVIKSDIELSERSKNLIFAPFLNMKKRTENSI